MDAVRDGDDPGVPVVGKFQRLQGTHGISGKADPHNGVLSADAQHLLKHLAQAGGFQKHDPAPDHVQVKAQKLRQRRAAADPKHIDRLRVQQDIHRRVEGRRIQAFRGRADIVHIPCQNALDHLGLASSRVPDPHAVHRVQAARHPRRKLCLHLRIAGIADPRSEAHHGGFADMKPSAQPRRRHEGRLVIVLQDKSRDRLMTLAHMGKFFIDPRDDVPALLHDFFLLSICPPSASARFRGRRSAQSFLKSWIPGYSRNRSAGTADAFSSDDPAQGKGCPPFRRSFSGRP